MQLICAYVFAYAKSRFSHDVAHMSPLQVNSILRHVGELLDYRNDEELDDLYKKTAWMFDDKYKKQGAAYEAFKHAVTYVCPLRKIKVLWEKTFLRGF